jgi:polar amino acid transport system permease protein
MKESIPDIIDQEAAMEIDPKKLLSRNLSLIPWWFVAIILLIVYVSFRIISSYLSIERLLIHQYDFEHLTKIELFADDPELTLGTKADTTSFRTAANFLSENEIVIYTSYDDAVEALIRGQIDAVILKESSSGKYIKDFRGGLILRGRSLSENNTENYWEAIEFIYVGLFITIRVSILSYLIAVVFGLIAGLGRIANNKFFYNLATLYVELIRGIPIIVLIFYIALVGVPSIVELVNEFGVWLASKGITSIGIFLSEVTIRNVPNEGRAIFALSVTYGAFLAEIFRAGVQSVGRGQSEAARSLGMSRGQAMRYVILPQAIRNVLPALANDFVAMVKDSSLVSVLAVEDITQRSRKYTGTSFAFREAFNILTLLYLTMTVTLSILVRTLERRLSQDD